MDEPLVYTLAEAAHALGISVGTLQTLVRNGEVPYVKLGARKVFVRATLAQVLHEREQTDDKDVYYGRGIHRAPGTQGRLRRVAGQA